MPMADIGLVEGDDVLRRTLARTLEEAGHTVREAESGEQAVEIIGQSPPDLVITSLALSGMGGDELLRTVRESNPAMAAILMSEPSTVDRAVESARANAASYVRKPVDRNELLFVVAGSLEQAAAHKELDYYRQRDLADSEVAGIVGASPAIRQLRALVGRLASLEKRDGVGPTVLLAGEAGTGKALTARAIHKASPRAGAPFVEVNCRAIPDNLLEAELLGYEKGAFSDAASPKTGVIEAAEGGTLFFDEIGNIGKPLQARILKLLDDRVIRRLGSARDRSVRCTVIAATQHDLEQKVAAGDFLDDLSDRLGIVKLDIPPLRSRDNDVLLVADHFVKMHAAEYGFPPPRLSPRAISAIKGYPWPGNVRELSHVLERAMVLNPGAVVEDHQLALQGEETPGTRLRISRIDDLDVDFGEGGIRLQEVEIGLIKRAMEFTHGNQVRSAKLLGLSRDALRYRLEKYKLR